MVLFGALALKIAREKLVNQGKAGLMMATILALFVGIFEGIDY
jgi:hypothetical protein